MELCNNSHLLSERRKRKIQVKKFVILDSTLTNPPITKILKDSGFPLVNQPRRKKARFNPIFIYSQPCKVVTVYNGFGIFLKEGTFTHKFNAIGIIENDIAVH